MVRDKHNNATGMINLYVDDGITAGDQLGKLKVLGREVVQDVHGTIRVRQHDYYCCWSVGGRQMGLPRLRNSLVSAEWFRGSPG